MVGVGGWTTRHSPASTCRRFYDRYTRRWRDRKFTLLEIGVYEGRTLRTYQQYFHRARIVGLDIDPAAAEKAPEFQVYVGDQADTDLLDRVLDDLLPDLMFVIDDGSHINELTIKTFNHLFERLPSGAIYAIEDLGTTYGPPHLHPYEGVDWPGLEYVHGVKLENPREPMDRFILGLHDDCHARGRDRTVAWVHTWPMLLLVGRA